MWFSWQSTVTLNSGLLPHQHFTYPTQHPDHGWIIPLLFNTFSPWGNSFPFPFWISPFFLALIFIYFFNSSSSFPTPPQIVPGTHCDPEQPNFFLHAGGNCGFVSFWVRAPRREEGWEVLAWNAAPHGHSSSLFPRGSQEAACLERAGLVSGGWWVNSLLFWEGSDEFLVNQWPVPGYWGDVCSNGANTTKGCPFSKARLYKALRFSVTEAKSAGISWFNRAAQTIWEVGWNTFKICVIS